MRKSKFTESQIAGILKEAEAGVAVADVARKHGISAEVLRVAFQVRRHERVGPAAPARTGAGELILPLLFGHPPKQRWPARTALG